MCVLSGPEIEKRATEIFMPGTWDKVSVQEATYDLRVDTKPLLRIGGESYDQDQPYPRSYLTIEPGELAMLPTMESFQMPNDLVGSIKIKLSHSNKGLTPLFGPKVDPHFGREHGGERLYLWVSNLGLDPIFIQREDRVFTVQFHKLYGDAPPLISKQPVYHRMATQIRKMAPEQNLGFMDSLKKQVAEQSEVKFSELEYRLTGLERGNQRVVQFGVFLVASALLAGAITAMFAMIFSLNSGAGLAATGRSEGANLEGWLFAMTIVLCIGVVLLFVGAVIQFSRSERRE